MSGDMDATLFHVLPHTTVRFLSPGSVNQKSAVKCASMQMDVQMVLSFYGNATLIRR